MTGEIIKQKKTNEELNNLSNKIIDSLKDCNLAEKYKIISCLFSTLKDIIKKEGIIISKE